MNFDPLTVILSAIGSLLISVAKPLLDFYRTRKEVQAAELEQEHKHELDTTQQAFEVYKQLVETLTTNLSKLSDEIRQMQEAQARCHEENASLRSEVKSLKEKVELLTTQIQANQEVTKKCLNN